MKQLFAAVIVGIAAVVSLGAQPDLPPALAAMADAEREFARTATVKGWRDAFLDFFADDAIAFTPEVALAKERLKKEPSRPFTEVELVWEPRTGDVAASGDLGWLTGPSTSLDRKAPEPKPRHGCYLSIWRKQPDGTWRVIIDVGANSPEPVAFAPGFTRMAFGARYTGSDGKEAAGRSLADADRDLNAQIAAKGTAPAFRGAMAPASRLHRPGTAPLVGRDAIGAWLDAKATAGTATQTAVEAAKSGDFGYSYGRFDVTAPKPLAGVYVRLWARDASGKWWLTVDVAQPFK
jgi:ketosteroid isomerase-like protein